MECQGWVKFGQMLNPCSLKMLITEPIMKTTTSKGEKEKKKMIHRGLRQQRMSNTLLRAPPLEAFRRRAQLISE